MKKKTCSLSLITITLFLLIEKLKTTCSYDRATFCKHSPSWTFCRWIISMISMCAVLQNISTVQSLQCITLQLVSRSLLHRSSALKLNIIEWTVSVIRTMA